MQATTGKLLAVLAALACFATIAVMHGALDEDMGWLAALLGGALILIWFAEPLGSYVGPSFDEGAISRTTPPVLLGCLGWLILLGVAGLWCWFRIRPA